MIKQYIKKHHIKLWWITLSVSVVIILISVVWSLGIINLPPSFVYLSRQLSGAVVTKPGLTAELAIKFHKQEHSLSCEAAAVKMILDYYGLGISESEIIENMLFDATKRSGNIWGDPDAGFVGNIDGKMGVDGYGIHWDPIAKLISKWRKAEVITNGLARDLAFHISEGHPIIVWGYSGRIKSMSWFTLEGKKVYAINGEHTRVVYGFRGDLANPDGFLVMDPIYGSAYWEKSKFLRNWDAFGRMGVVVY